MAFFQKFHVILTYFEFQAPESWVCRDCFPKTPAASFAMDSMLSREILRSRDLDEEAMAGFVRNWEVGFDIYIQYTSHIHPIYTSIYQIEV